MPEVIVLQDPENYKAVHGRIKHLLKEGQTEFLPHAQKRMQHRGLDDQDIIHILKYGQIVEHSKPDDLWRYTISGKSIDQKKAKCVVEINDRLIIVTVIK